MSKTSQGAWVRFCKSLGYDGMKSLKNALFNEINNAKEEADENAIEFSDSLDMIFGIETIYCVKDKDIIENIR